MVALLETEELTLGGEHTMQYVDDVLQNCTLDTYVILLANVSPINLTKTKKETEAQRR